MVDFAAMRDAVQQLGGDPAVINPVCPADLVVDHSIQVDHYGDIDALAKNQQMEFERNHERFLFLKVGGVNNKSCFLSQWGARALRNMRIIPPGSGIVHQVNLEYLARVVFCADANLLYPDSVVGTDSHTTMISGLGVLGGGKLKKSFPGWGVGGIEAEAVMLCQPISLVLPKVIGVNLRGRMPQHATSTDLVLTLTEMLRKMDVVGKLVEFHGSGTGTLSIADRATIANMCPEYGATAGYCII